MPDPTFSDSPMNAGPERFCILSYRSPDLALAKSGPVVALVILGEGGRLQFFIAPEFRSVMTAEDVEYFTSLLRDFRERASDDPEALFAQLTELNVGPLATEEVGSDIANHPSVMELRSRFVQEC
jgi:hypothetical protein